MNTNLLTACLGICLLAAPSQGQFLERLLNPDVVVTLEHPPYLPLKVKTVAFGAPQGECSESLNDTVEGDFHNGGVEVVDREHLSGVLSEHKLQVSGLVDATTAARVGQMLGAQALVFLKVLRCDIDHSTTRHTCTQGKTQYPCTKYHTRANLDGSLRTVDLTTGRVLAAKKFSGSAAAESWEGYPGGDELQRSSEADVAGQIHRMFFPWSEQRKLVFYDDKDCNLRTAFQLVRGQDLMGALDLSRQNLELCRGAATKPKIVAHAHYNVGMLLLLQNDHGGAMAEFNEAMKLGGGEIVASAMAECRRSQALATEMARYEENQAAVLEDLTAGSAGGGRNSGIAADAKPTRGGQGTAGGVSSIEDKLKQLDGLLKQGLITQDEYKKKKAQLLAEL